MPVPAQEGITRDNVTVRVDAVVYFRVIDPVRAVVEVQDYLVRGLAGRADVAALDHRQERPRRPAVSNRERLNQGLELMLDSPVERLGHRRGPGRDQGRRAARLDEAVDVPAGRGRARASLADHHRRWRAAGFAEARPGGDQLMSRRRPRSSCGCCRRSSRSRRRRTPRWCCRSPSSCCASSRPRRPPGQGRAETAETGQPAPSRRRSRPSRSRSRTGPGQARTDQLRVRTAGRSGRPSAQGVVVDDRAGDAAVGRQVRAPEA